MKFLQKIYPVMLVILLVMGAGSLKADDPGNPGDILGGGGSGTNAEGVPLDGGVSILAVAGGVVALKKLRKKTVKS
jgi:hypothetical protein